MAVIADRIAAMGTENAFKIGDDVARAQARGMEVIRFTLGEPDFDTAPHISQAGIDSILSRQARKVAMGDPPGGTPVLYPVVCPCCLPLLSDWDRLFEMTASAASPPPSSPSSFSLPPPVPKTLSPSSPLQA